MSALLAAALAYAAHQIPVFPCLPRGKTPAIARGFHAATTNPETIRRYWRQSDRNVAIATGVSARAWVLDVDGDVGEASLRALEATHGKLPETWVAKTGGGGRHLWFKYTGPIPSTAGKIARGIDTRGDLGYVIAPPSQHASGQLYEWRSYDQIAIAPDWIVNLERAKPQSISERALATITAPTRDPDAYGRAALDSEISMLAAVLPGSRNNALNLCAFRLFRLVGGGELSSSTVEQRLFAACEANGLLQDDGERAVRKTIASGAGAGRQYPRTRFTR
jgi:bifunctional DNA primase/polymerase-like protein